jgi:hypothetical protein
MPSRHLNLVRIPCFSKAYLISYSNVDLDLVGFD